MKYHEIVGYAIMHLADTYCVDCAKEIAENNDWDIDDEEDHNFYPIFAGTEQLEGNCYCGECFDVIKECDHSIDKDQHIFSVEEIDKNDEDHAFYMKVIAICKWCGRENEDLTYEEYLHHGLGKLTQGELFHKTNFMF